MAMIMKMAMKMKMAKMMKWFVLVLVVMCCVFFVSGAMTAAAAAEPPIKVVLDGVELQFDVQPMLINDRTMVPMRVIFEALGATVNWDGTNSIVTAIKGADVIKTAIGYKYMHINEYNIEMDVAPVEVNGRTLVPARFISEALGCDVKWDDQNNTVRITSSNDDRPYALAKKLLENRAKIINLGQIAHYNDQIYAAEYLCMPGWKPIESNYIGAFALLNDKIYRTDGYGTGDPSTNLYSTSLDGSNEVFIDTVENWGDYTYIIGDKLIYVTFESDGETIAGMRIFDTATSKKVNLPIYGRVISFDDEYLYLLVAEETDFGETAVTEFWRAKWDGSLIEKTNVLNGISTRYFNSDSPSRDSENLYFLVRGHENYGSYSGDYSGFYDDGVMGISIVSIDGLKWKGYFELATNNDARASDAVLINNGWVYYIRGSAIYKTNLSDGSSSKLSDMHPAIQWEIASFIDVIDGYIYMRGYTGGESGPNMTLFRIPVNGGTMERTEKTWYES